MVGFGSRSFRPTSVHDLASEINAGTTLQVVGHANEHPGAYDTDNLRFSSMRDGHKEVEVVASFIPTRYLKNHSAQVGCKLCLSR